MTDVRWAANGSDAAVVARVAAAVDRPGPVTLCLPGGNTPRPIFARLAVLRLPWDKVTIIPGDERAVPHDHPASNVGALRAVFGATGAMIEPLLASLPVPRFDLVWLGVGDDGHVASLFPNANPDPAAPAGVIAVTPDPMPPEAPFPRLTLTLAALANTDTVILVARGAAKRAVLDAALAGADLPVARLFGLAPVTLYWQP
jgi:6-phosphogluconolactonase